VKNESAQTPVRVTALVEQPSPEVCSQPAYVLDCLPGMAQTGYCIGGWQESMLLIHRVCNRFPIFMEMLLGTTKAILNGQPKD
jgi:hypothetical protein